MANILREHSKISGHSYAFPSVLPNFIPNSAYVKSREDAVIWICKNQIGRRNITDEQRTYLLGKQYEATKRRYGGDRKSSSHNEDLNRGRTAIRVSEEMGVSGSTVERAGNFATGMDAIGASEPKLKGDILSGKVSVPKMDIQSIAKIPELERPAAIEKIRRAVE